MTDLKNQIATLDLDRLSNEPDVCPNCFGSGMQIVPGKGAKPCGCRGYSSLNVMLAKAKLPHRYQGNHFNNYNAQNGTQARALKLSMETVMKYPNVRQGILLTGPVGVGKTLLAVSMLKAFIERGFSSLFYEFGTLVKEIQKTYNSASAGTESAVLEPLFKTEILALDEIGATKSSAFVLDTLGHIINTRYNDNKMTIFTTNYGDRPTDFFPETLADRIGPRLRSRIMEMCATVDVDGTDYRQRINASH